MPKIPIHTAEIAAPDSSGAASPQAFGSLEARGRAQLAQGISQLANGMTRFAGNFSEIEAIDRRIEDALEEQKYREALTNAEIAAVEALKQAETEDSPSSADLVPGSDEEKEASKRPALLESFAKRFDERINPIAETMQGGYAERFDVAKNFLRRKGELNVNATIRERNLTAHRASFGRMEAQMRRQALEPGADVNGLIEKHVEDMKVAMDMGAYDREAGQTIMDKFRDDVTSIHDTAVQLGIEQRTADSIFDFHDNARDREAAARVIEDPKTRKNVLSLVKARSDRERILDAQEKTDTLNLYEDMIQEEGKSPNELPGFAALPTDVQNEVRDVYEQVKSRGIGPTPIQAFSKFEEYMDVYNTGDMAKFLSRDPRREIVALGKYYKEVKTLYDELNTELKSKDEADEFVRTKFPFSSAPGGAAGIIRREYPGPENKELRDQILLEMNIGADNDPRLKNRDDIEPRDSRELASIAISKVRETWDLPVVGVVARWPKWIFGEKQVREMTKADRHELLSIKDFSKLPEPIRDLTLEHLAAERERLGLDPGEITTRDKMEYVKTIFGDDGWIASMQKDF